MLANTLPFPVKAESQWFQVELKTNPKPLTFPPVPRE
jgi:hypothetical protein